MTIGDAVRGTRPPRIPPITTSVHAGNFMPLRWKKLDVLILDGATFKGHARLFLIPSASYNYGFFSHRHTGKWSIVGSSPWLCRNLRRH